MTPLQALLAIAAALLFVLLIRYRVWLRIHTRRASAESQVIQTRLGPVEYDDRGAGPAVLHFHGGNVGHNGWFVLQPLLDAGFRLLTPDRPGYQGTRLKGHESPEAQADLFAALLDSLEVERVALVAVSAGGPAAIQFAHRFPERVSCLVLMAAITRKTGLSSDQLNSALGKLVMSRRAQNPAYFLIHRAMHLLPGLTLRDFARTETTYDPGVAPKIIAQVTGDPAQLQQVRQLADAMVPALPRFPGVMNDLEVQQALPDLQLESLALPTLIIHSRYDGDVPFAGAEEAAQRIPGAELIAVDQFGHFVWWGDPDVTREFQQRMLEFLRSATGE